MCIDAGSLWACRYLAWASSILKITADQDTCYVSKVWWFVFIWACLAVFFSSDKMIGTKSWLLTCISNITLFLHSGTGSALKRELNFCNGNLSLLYFCACQSRSLPYFLKVHAQIEPQNNFLVNPNGFCCQLARTASSRNQSNWCFLFKWQSPRSRLVEWVPSTPFWFHH